MFGECVDKFLDKLKPLADGRTQVPMKKHIHNAALDVISKVLICIIRTVYMYSAHDLIELNYMI